jgi:hypothetical protein
LPLGSKFAPRGEVKNGFQNQVLPVDLLPEPLAGSRHFSGSAISVQQSLVFHFKQIRISRFRISLFPTDSITTSKMGAIGDTGNTLEENFFSYISLTDVRGKFNEVFYWQPIGRQLFLFVFRSGANSMSHFSPVF